MKLFPKKLNFPHKKNRIYGNAVNQILFPLGNDIK